MSNPVIEQLYKESIQLRAKGSFDLANDMSSIAAALANGVTDQFALMNAGNYHRLCFLCGPEEPCSCVCGW